MNLWYVNYLLIKLSKIWKEYFLGNSAWWKAVCYLLCIPIISFGNCLKTCLTLTLNKQSSVYFNCSKDNIAEVNYYSLFSYLHASGETKQRGHFIGVCNRNVCSNGMSWSPLIMAVTEHQDTWMTVSHSSLRFYNLKKKIQPWAQTWNI